VLSKKTSMHEVMMIKRYRSGINLGPFQLSLIGVFPGINE